MEEAVYRTEERPSYVVVRRSWLRQLADREGFLGPLFLAPAVIYIIALVGLPFLLAIAFSLSDVTVGDTTLDFVGLENFRAIIGDSTFRLALVQTVAFTLIVMVLILVLSTILSEILYQDFRGKWLARTLIMLPWATPISLGALGWLWLLDSKFSPIDWLLRNWHLLGAPGALLGTHKNLFYLGRTTLARASVILVQVWRILPLATVIVLAGLTSLSQDLLDQAKVDGAGYFRTLFQVKLPLLLPIMTVAVLFGTIFTFTDMAVVFILTRGGPRYDTQVLALWAYFKGVEGGNLAHGAAIALFFSPLLLAAAILVLRVARRAEVV